MLDDSQKIVKGRCMSNNYDASRIGCLLRRIDISLLALIVILATMNIPYWTQEFMVGHDTKNTYLFFHYVYNHLVWYGELPQWLPFGEYGYSTLFYQICNLSPCSYLVGFLGWVLRVKDTLILFKLAAFGDQMLFLFGLHLISRRIYRHPVTCFIICLSGIGCVVWTWQIYWSLRFFYLLPLVLYFYYRFFIERLPWAFWAGILALLFSMVGGLPYWAPIYLYLFLVMTLIMLPEYWRAFTVLHRTGWRGGLLALLGAISAIALGYLLLTCLDGLHNYSPGRALNGMYSDLKTFLTYNNPLWQYAHSFFDGTMSSGTQQSGYPDDLNIYVGLIPVLALLPAIFYIRERFFCALFAGLLAIVLLAGNGMSSLALYWMIPGMKTFRHLGQLLTLAKILLLLSAGFGLELLILRLEARDWLKKHFSTFIYLTFLVGICIILDMVVSQTFYNPKSWVSPMHFMAMLSKGGEWIVLRLAAWAIILTMIFVCVRFEYLNKLLSSRVILGLLIIACLFDMGAFQFYHWQNRSKGSYIGRLELKPLQYHDVRNKDFSAESNKDNAIIKSTENASYHGYYTNIIQHDPCVPLQHVDIFPRGVHDLVTARGANPMQDKFWGTFLPFADQTLLEVLGCDSPKVRFVMQAEYGRTAQEISNKIRFSKSLDTTVILKGDPSQQKFGGYFSTTSSQMAYRPVFFSANRFDMDITVKPGSSGWLVYADSYNPRWKAYINGQKKPVLEAYGAFKAVMVGEGEFKLSFRYENRWQKYAAGFLAIFGMLLAFGCIVGLALQLFNGRRNVFYIDEL